MISGLRPYAELRDSGIPWLGRIPAHWEVRRIKYLLSERDSRSLTGTEQLLRVSQYTGVTERKRADDLDSPDTRAASLVGYKHVSPTDLVVNIMLAWNGSMGVSPFEGICSPAYCVYRFGSDAIPMYFHHLLRSPAYRARIKAFSRGVVDSRLRLYTEDLFRMEALVPPKDEQAAIVRFLNYADRRIRRAIAAKQKLIRLLEEQKQAIIHRAVTRGLDPDAPTEPSGIEWLDAVPEHCQRARLKHVADVQTGITLGKTYANVELVDMPYLRVANVQAGHLKLCDVARVRVPEAEARRSELREGDVLMTEGGDIDKLGRGCVWRGELTPCLHQNHVFAVRPHFNRLLPEFLEALMASLHGREYFRRTAKQTTNLAATNSTTLGNFPLMLPAVEEQHSILEKIRRDTTSLDAASVSARREIELLREYRTRLIADVVTGKLDVRATAERLPESPGPEIPDDDALDEEGGGEASPDEAIAEDETA